MSIGSMICVISMLSMTAGCFVIAFSVPIRTASSEEYVSGNVHREMIGAFAVAAGFLFFVLGGSL